MNTEEQSSEYGLDPGPDVDVAPSIAHGTGRPSLRLVGEGGAAVVLSPVSMYVRGARSTQFEAGFDIALVDPDHYLVFRNRRVSEPEIADLSRFLTAGLVAEDRIDFESLCGGFSIALIPTTDPNEVIVRFELDPLVTFGHTAPFRFVFVTTRVACWGASRAASRLAPSDVELDPVDGLADMLRNREEGEAS